MTNKIALLIDCDNASHHTIEGILKHLSQYGTINIRHAHGDWSSPSLSGWREKLPTYFIKPMQQFAYTKGKNATDSAMIIDAMDLLYSDNIDAFALITSDSDFTPLVLRILESGKPIYGFGEKKAPKAFSNACSQFIYTEELTPKNNYDKKENTHLSLQNNKTNNDTCIGKLLETAAKQTAADDGWTHMSKLGSHLAHNTSFSPTNHGHKKLSKLVESTKLFDIQMRNNGTVMYIKPRLLSSKSIHSHSTVIM